MTSATGMNDGATVGPPSTPDHITYVESARTSTQNFDRIFTFHHDTFLAEEGNSPPHMVLHPMKQPQMEWWFIAPFIHSGSHIWGVINAFARCGWPLNRSNQPHCVVKNTMIWNWSRYQNHHSFHPTGTSNPVIFNPDRPQYRYCAEAKERAGRDPRQRHYRSHFEQLQAISLTGC